jgi:hypothetical protein
MTNGYKWFFMHSLDYESTERPNFSCILRVREGKWHRPHLAPSRSHWKMAERYKSKRSKVGSISWDYIDSLKLLSWHSKWVAK